jgi:hypothetical protein
MLTSNNGNYNPNFNNGNSNNGEPKQRTNFPLGKFKTADGRLDAGIWVSQYGIVAKMVIRQQCGKDPSTNAPIYENKAPMELPQALFDREKMNLFIRLVEANDYQNLNFQIPGNTTTTVVSEGNNIKITITNTKTNDTRSITFEGFTNNGKTFNAQMYTLVNWFKMVYKKALTQRLDDADFNISSDSGSDEDTPF